MDPNASHNPHVSVNRADGLFAYYYWFTGFRDWRA